MQVLANTRFPAMLEWNDPRIGNSYVLPDEALADVAMPSEAELAERPVTFMQQGVQHFRKGEYPQAVASFRACLSRQPDYPEATFSLGVALAEAGQLDDALGCLQAAVAKEPHRAEIHQSLGGLYSRMRRPEDVVAAYEKALERQPDDALVHRSLGITLLQLGDYRRGLKEYEWRLKTGQVQSPQVPQPRWEGEPVPDKTLLLRTEGRDTGQAIQLARYIPLGAERCGKLLLTCDDDLAALFCVIPGIGDIRRADTSVSAISLRTCP